MGRVFRALLVGWLLLYATLGLAWIGVQLGSVILYGDSFAYNAMSRTLRTHAGREIGYPVFLRAVSALDGGALRAEIARAHREWQQGKPPPLRGRLALPALQLLLFLAALLFAARRLFAVERPGAGWLRWAPALLVFVDPVLSHFQFAVMSDGVALSASLVTCAALGSLLTGSRSPRRDGIVFGVSALGLCLLRPEKRWVLAGTLVTLAAPLVLARGASSRRRAAALLLAAVVLVGASLSLQRATRDPARRWPLALSLLQQRVVFPNLAAVYPALPPDLRARFTLDDARRHDATIQGGRAFFNRLSRGSPEELERLVESIAAVVLRERLPRIALDVASDALENLAAPVSFHARLLAWVAEGAPEEAHRVRKATAPKTFYLLSREGRRLAAAVVSVAGILQLLGCAWLVRRCLAQPRERPPLSLRWRVWLPLLVFSAFNAAAFAATQDRVNVRYALISYAGMLLALYGSLPAALRARRGRASDGACGYAAAP